MQKIVNTYLNVRVGNPSANATCLQYLVPGTVVDVIESAAGTAIEGNNTWFKDVSHNYYWSGGFQNDTLVEKIVSHLKDVPITKFISPEDLSYLRNFVGIEGIGWTIEKQELNVSIFYSGTTPNILPKELTIQTGVDNISRIPVKIKTTTVFKAHNKVKASDAIKNKIPLKDTVGNINLGSLGYFVICKDSSKPRAITCYHVVRNNLQDFAIDSVFPHSFDITKESDNSDIGLIIEGGISEDLDVALISLFDQIDIESRIPLIGKVVNTKEITDIDLHNRTPVYMFGMQSFYQSGFCTDIMKEANINYGIEAKKMNNLIVIENDGKPFSQGGDSGSLVVDENNAAIGIIVAGNENQSLVIPISRILSKFKAKILITKT